GGDRRRDLLRLGELHVADQAIALFARGIVHAIDADIDHDGAGFHHVAAHKLRLADGDDEDVRLERVLLDVPGARVAHGDGSIATRAVLQQLGSHWPSHDVRAPHDDGVRSFRLDARADQVLLHPLWLRWSEA